MLKINLNYNIKNDLEFLLESKQISIIDLASKLNISRATIDEILKYNRCGDDICEKIYSFMYQNNYRLNITKEEILKEKTKNVLFHGSKDGLSQISISSSRKNCDFGQGFYLGESYNQALSFICEKENSSIYSFSYNPKDLIIKEFNTDLDWMLVICYYRGTIDEYKENPIIKKLIKKVETADIIIAPIADNKMFYIMSQFTLGEINADVALHSLSASSLGRQFVFRTENAINNLIPFEKYFISSLEKEECKKKMNQRAYEIDTKLKLAKREFKNGLFIEEILK